MAVRLSKAWVPVDVALDRLRGNLGVFQLAAADHRVVLIGFAGGRSPHGLRGEVASAAHAHPIAVFVRVEITTAYHTRYRELLMAHVADHGCLPELNAPINLGRLSPA